MKEVSKLKKRIQISLFVITLMAIYFSTGRCVYAETLTYGDFQYTKSSESSVLGYATITKYTGDGGTVVIPEEIDGYSVTVIASSAFASTSVTNVTLPKSLTTLGDYAFDGCSALKQVSFQENTSNGYILTIGEGAFRNCGKLSSVLFSKNVTSIGNNAFRNDSSLEAVTLPSNLTTLGYDVFSGTYITKITIPKTLKSSSTAFDGAMQLEEVVIEDGMERIPTYLFKSAAIKTIKMPDSVKTIGGDAFMNCAGLVSIEWPAELGTIESYAFSGCNKLEDIEMPDTVTSIGAYAFASTGVKNITLQESLKTLGNYAFSGCTALIDIHLGSTITVIPEGCFSGCSNLETVVVPRQVTDLKASAFGNCPKLKTATIFQNVTSIQKNSFTDPTYMTIRGVKGSYAETEHFLKYLATVLITQE